MSKKLWMLLLLFMLQTPMTDAAENLVRNWDIEEGQGKEAYFWVTASWTDDANIFHWQSADDDQQAVYSGSYSLKITNNSPNHSRFKQTVAVKEDSYYKLSCYVKTADVPLDAGGASVSVMNGAAKSAEIHGSSDGFENIVLYGKTAQGQEALEIELGLGWFGSLNRGTVWFDDVVLEEITEDVGAYKFVNFYKSTDDSANNNIIDKIIAFGIILVLAAFILVLVFFISKSRSESEGSGSGDIVLNERQDAETSRRMNKKDFIIMGSMTFIYLCVMLFNLGSTKVPSTFWRGSVVGESVLVKFEQVADISRVYYYSGLRNGKYRLEYQNAQGNFEPLATIDNKDFYKWEYIQVMVNTDCVKVIADGDFGGDLGEIVFVEYSGQEFRPVKASIVESPEKYAALLDEQNLVEISPTFKTSTYFDEIYHAKTAYEHLNKIEPTETSHPPLGKIFISLGIALFGMNPFGWRVIGVLFGVGIIPVMYVFGKKFFGKTFYAFCTAFLMMMDFMNFVQARIATIDVYAVLFILLMYYYMYDYFVNKPYDAGFKKSITTLFLCGLFFGIGSASKWICIYSGGGLALLFAVQMFSQIKEYMRMKNNKKYRKGKDSAWLDNFMSLHVRGTVLCCVLFFVVIPIIIYILSYIPFMMVEGPGHGLKDLWPYQVNMYKYHSQLVATHSFSSSWWEWPILKKPMWFYTESDLPDNLASTIVSMGNPAVWWIGLFSFFASIVVMLQKVSKGVQKYTKKSVSWLIGLIVFLVLLAVALLVEFKIDASVKINPALIWSVIAGGFVFLFWLTQKADRRMTVIFVAFAFQYVPWIFVSRIAFIYHFYSSVPFIIICTVYVMEYIIETLKRKYVVYGYLALVFVLFLAFYPAISAAVVPKLYITALKWFNWIF